LGELVFVGLGLYDEMDISLRGLDEVKTADYVFAELYTSLMSGLDIGKLASLTGKEVVLVSRRMLEEDNGEEITSAVQRGKAVLLVPGDPLIATTHVELRIRAERTGIKTRVIHGASIVSAAVALSGLQNYKFGKSVTIPFSKDGTASETPCIVIKENVESGLHTFCFLDIKAEEKRYMTIKEALETLLKIEEGKRMIDRSIKLVYDEQDNPSCPFCGRSFRKRYDVVNPGRSTLLGKQYGTKQLLGIFAAYNALRHATACKRKSDRREIDLCEGRILTRSSEIRNLKKRLAAISSETAVIKHQLQCLRSSKSHLERRFKQLEEADQ